MSALEIRLAGETLRLLPERAIHWPARQTLLVADLHWGKDESFRRRGTALPRGILEDDLERLSRCIRSTGTQSVYVLGDLIHDRDGMSQTVIDQVSEWRERQDCRIVLTVGNHDRHFPKLPEAWRIKSLDTHTYLPPFRLQHEAAETPGAYTLGGHIHPVVSLHSRTDRLRLPCFHFGPTYGTLPAFSRFTGGGPIKVARSDRIYAITEDAVQELSH